MKNVAGVRFSAYRETVRAVLASFLASSVYLMCLVWLYSDRFRCLKPYISASVQVQLRFRPSPFLVVLLTAAVCEGIMLM